jgi:CubicO group peptidase (beta-lactamase class C family)
MKVLGILMLSGIALTIPSPAFGGGAAPSTLAARVDAYLAPYVANRDFSGVVLIARGDEILVRKAYGMASFELGVPNTPATKFRIASLTKTFTAAAIVMLKERGRLRYEDKLSKFVPEYPHSDKITIRNLLDHEAGVPNPDYGKSFCQQSQPIDQVVQALGKKPLDFPPGTREQYSNGGYLLLARAVEKISGQTYDEFLRRNIFEPLGMADTGNYPAESLVPGRACGYFPAPLPAGLENAPLLDLSTSFGSGSLYSTVNDLFRWARAVRAEQLFKIRSLPYPFGWGKRKHLGHDGIEQAGITTGFQSKLLVYFDDPVTVICLANVESGMSRVWERDLLPMIFENKGSPMVSLPKPASVDREKLTGCLGDYRSPAGFVVHITECDGRLYSSFNDWPVRSYLMPTSENELFMRTEFATIHLRRGRRDQVREMTWQWSNVGEPMKFVRIEKQ